MPAQSSVNANKMKQLEILAPAGGMEPLIAGVRCGADAVYLGGKAFSARQNAGNFDHETLKSAVNDCHVRGVKVYLTVNTLMDDKELDRALFAVQDGVNAGVDGLIVQDLGLAKLVRQYFPTVPLHASTQMSVMSVNGFRLLHDMGFVRAVIPREMQEKEIAAIHNAVPLALEAFVHGALCMCVSGQCYLSAVLGSRSGNRGLCAQPCRLPFFVKEEGRYVLSLKDLSLVEKMQRMAAAGVTSFKIEGRMKRPEYVAAAVTACKEAKNGSLQQGSLSALQSVFSRSGFTDGYFTGKLGPTMFGIRQKEDVLSAKGVLAELAQRYHKEVPLVPVDITVEMRTGQPVRLCAAARGKQVVLCSETLPQQAVNCPATKESLALRMRKCGGTPFYAGAVEIRLEEGLMFPVSELNALRRNALDALAEQLAQTGRKTYHYTQFDWFGVQQEKLCVNSMEWRGVFDAYDSVPENGDKLSMLFLPLRETVTNFAQAVGRFACVGVVLPRGMFGNETEITERLARLWETGVRHVLTGNLGGVKTALEMGFTVHGDFGLNVFNSASLQVLSQMGVASQTLSFELRLQQMNRMKKEVPAGAILYGRLPLMLTRNCPVKNELSCKQCGRSASLTDRKGIRFPVRCDFGCSELLNSRPVYMADRVREVQLDFGTLLFTTESRREAGAVIDACLAGEAPKGEFTRGLYYRGVE